MKKKSKTQGKRTARPGSQAADAAGRSTVKRNATLAPKSGKRVAGTTAKHVVAHQRAAGQRRHNKGGKKR
jgi:hypothetical protein